MGSEPEKKCVFISWSWWIWQFVAGMTAGPYGTSASASAPALQCNMSKETDSAAAPMSCVSSSFVLLHLLTLLLLFAAHTQARSSGQVVHQLLVQPALLQHQPHVRVCAAQRYTGVVLVPGG